jgi:hypothetical protein
MQITINPDEHPFLYSLLSEVSAPKTRAKKLKDCADRFAEWIKLGRQALPLDFGSKLAIEAPIFESKVVSNADNQSPISNQKRKPGTVNLTGAKIMQPSMQDSADEDELDNIMVRR